jgi:hypothetical protein
MLKSFPSSYQFLSHASVKNKKDLIRTIFKPTRCVKQFLASIESFKDFEITFLFIELS